MEIDAEVNTLGEVLTPADSCKIMAVWEACV